MMETLYSSWNPGEQYHLTSLSGGGPSSHSHHHQLNSTSSSFSSSSPSSSSSSSSSPSSTVAALMAATSYLVDCDTPPTPLTCESVMFNGHTNGQMFYSPTVDPSTNTMVNSMDTINYDYQQQQTINSNYNDQVPSDYYNSNVLTTGQSVFLSHDQTNYSIPTSMESPANTSYSSPSPSPDLWENYGPNDNVKHLNHSSHINLVQSNHHHLNQHHQQHSIPSNYQHPAQHQNGQDNESTYTLNESTTGNAINSINNNKGINVNPKTPINSMKSTNHRVSYKIKKSQSETNFVKTESNVMNENVSKSPTGTHRINHHHHHRSIESRGGFDKYLTPEDEERRRRRRERNKVAATKCRNKKKVHVYKLCQESQTLESTNFSLKEEMENLKREEQRLNEILVKHLPFCVRRTLQPISDSINV